MGDHIRIEADISVHDPQRTEKRAKVFQAGLSEASASPSIRLRMILGEAYQKFQTLAEWVAHEIEKDEEKAPGLIDLALRWTVTPGMLQRGLPDSVPPHLAEIQELLLVAAMDTSTFHDGPDPDANPPLPCGNDCISPTGCAAAHGCMRPQPPLIEHDGDQPA